MKRIMLSAAVVAILGVCASESKGQMVIPFGRSGLGVAVGNPNSYNQGWNNQGFNQGWNNPGYNQGWGNQGFNQGWGNQGFNQGWGNQRFNQGLGNQAWNNRGWNNGVTTFSPYQQAAPVSSGYYSPGSGVYTRGYSGYYSTPSGYWGYNQGFPQRLVRP